jgi:hypothetical protein
MRRYVSGGVSLSISLRLRSIPRRQGFGIGGFAIKNIFDTQHVQTGSANRYCVQLTNLSQLDIKWGFLLPGGFSFGTKMSIGASDLSPGTYKISALYSSFGVDMNTHLNPALSSSAVLASLLPFSWKGDVASNEITIRVIGSHQGKQTK